MKLNEFLALTDAEQNAMIETAIQQRKIRMNAPEALRAAQRAAEKVAAGQRITVTEFECLTGVMFSHHMTDKMSNILALSSNCLANPVCLARIKAGIGICAECFAASVETRYSGVFENTSYNAQLLSSMVLPASMIPVIDADELRIESFGDTANWIQAANYLQMAIYNPLVPVTAWTKNPGHYAEAIRRGYRKPDNFTLIISSVELNTPCEIKPEFAAIIDKRFTVYTLEYLDTNGIGMGFINCGGRSCKTCQRCYNRAKTTGFDVRELLKADARKAEKRETWITDDGPAAADIPAGAAAAAAADILAMFRQ